MGRRQVWDLHHRQYRLTGVVAVPVRHPNVEGGLWLAVSHTGKGRTPWYLLTSETIGTADDDRRVVPACVRRWQVEICHRACRPDQAMKSPCLCSWGNCLNLLLLVSLVYAFLLSFLAPHPAPPMEELLMNRRHRTGGRNRQAAMPLSGLRAVFSSLRLSHPPVQNLG